MSTQTTLDVYGIKTCDTCRKALKALKEAGVEHTWIDLKTQEVPADILNRLIEGHLAGEIKAINKSSTAWRSLSDADKTAINANDKAAIAGVLTATPLLIKRPLCVQDDTISCGFDATVQARLLA